MLDLLKEAIDKSIIARDTERFAVHDIAPGTVVEPGSADEAAAVLRLASEHGWRVECAGNGTQAFGNRRTRVDLVISTRKMTDIVEYEPADLVIGVQAGMTFQQLQRETRKNAQHLAQDPPTSDRSTVGGVIATSRSGPLRYAHGTMRDHVLGLQMVTADGRVLQLGGRVVKNVAGYDLVRLLVGSAGTLGLITAAYLRLKPLPQTEETVVMSAGSASLLLEIAQFITDLHLEAQAIELLGPAVDSDSWSLLIRLAGNHESVADAKARIEARSRELRAGCRMGGSDDWYSMRDIELEACTAVRVADLPARIEATLGAVQRLADRIPASTRIAAHAGDGIVRLLIGESAVDETAFAIGETRAQLAVSGGTVVVHSRTAELIRRVDAFGATGPQLQLMAKLKNIFDPAGIMAPGRFVV
jgi:glycolate oxidase FAD binding subunit